MDCTLMQAAALNKGIATQLQASLLKTEGSLKRLAPGAARVDIACSQIETHVQSLIQAQAELQGYLMTLQMPDNALSSRPLGSSGPEAS